MKYSELDWGRNKNKGTNRSQWLRYNGRAVYLYRYRTVKAGTYALYTRNEKAYIHVPVRLMDGITTFELLGLLNQMEPIK